MPKKRGGLVALYVHGRGSMKLTWLPCREKRPKLALNPAGCRLRAMTPQWERPVGEGRGSAELNKVDRQVTGDLV